MNSFIRYEKIAKSIETKQISKCQRTVHRDRRQEEQIAKGYMEVWGGSKYDFSNGLTFL